MAICSFNLIREGAARAAQQRMENSMVALLFQSHQRRCRSCRAPEHTGAWMINEVSISSEKVPLVPPQSCRTRRSPDNRFQSHQRRCRSCRIWLQYEEIDAKIVSISSEKVPLVPLILILSSLFY